MEFSPGLRISPSLSLVRKLGQGGMGAVWVAEHLTLHTQVAVKFISDTTTQPGMRERFNREAAIAAQMKHPHAVQILDHGISYQGAPFIAMELLEGEDLRHRIQRLGRLSLTETSHILGQTCRALARAHSIGLVHRDIKPDNIFLIEIDGELFVKVLDFGIARQVQTSGQSATATGALLGTPHYMSPEQAMSAKHVDARADLWSLAVVAYHCVTGRVPFDGDTLPAVFVAIVNGKFEPPSGLVPGLPPAIDAWFAKALARDPDSRFSSAKDLADSFARAMVGASVEQVAVRQPEPSLVPAATEPGRSPGQPTLDGAAVSHARAAPPRRAVLAAAIAAVVCVATVGALAIVRLAKNPVPASEPSADSTAPVAVDSSSMPSSPPSAELAASPTAASAAASQLPPASGPDAGVTTDGRNPPTGTRTTKSEPGRDKPATTTTAAKPPAPAPHPKMPELGL